MTPLFSGYYDTVNAGMKQEAASYVKIAKAEEEAGLGDEGKWLFCSDMVRGKFSSAGGRSSIASADWRSFSELQRASRRLP